MGREGGWQGEKEGIHLSGEGIERESGRRGGKEREKKERGSREGEERDKRAGREPYQCWLNVLPFQQLCVNALSIFMLLTHLERSRERNAWKLICYTVLVCFSALV